MADDRKDKWISIMIVPEEGSGVKKWRITTRAFRRLKLFMGLVVIFLAIGAVSLFSVGVLYVKMRHYQRSNTRLLAAMNNFDTVMARLDRFEEKERLLRDLLGSNINLPKIQEDAAPVAVAEPPEEPAPSAPGNEIEQAIARREAEQRRRPDIWPVRAWQLTNRFAAVGGGQGGHYGIDIVASKGSNVTATADGRVVFAGEDEQLGRMVSIDHENGWETRYGHNRLLLVKYGDVVRKGQPIAIYGGAEGEATGVHLHYEMLFRKKPVDPLRYLPAISTLKITQEQ